MEPNPEATNLNHERIPEKLLGAPAAKTYLQITAMLVGTPLSVAVVSVLQTTEDEPHNPPSLVAPGRPR